MMLDVVFQELGLIFTSHVEICWNMLKYAELCRNMLKYVLCDC